MKLKTALFFLLMLSMVISLMSCSDKAWGIEQYENEVLIIG